MLAIVLGDGSARQDVTSVPSFRNAPSASTYSATSARSLSRIPALEARADFSTADRSDRPAPPTRPPCGEPHSDQLEGQEAGRREGDAEDDGELKEALLDAAPAAVHGRI